MVAVEVQGDVGEVLEFFVWVLLVWADVEDAESCMAACSEQLEKVVDVFWLFGLEVEEEQRQSVRCHMFWVDFICPLGGRADEVAGRVHEAVGVEGGGVVLVEWDDFELPLALWVGFREWREDRDRHVIFEPVGKGGQEGRFAVTVGAVDSYVGWAVRELCLPGRPCRLDCVVIERG